METYIAAKLSETRPVIQMLISSLIGFQSELVIQLEIVIIIVIIKLEC